MKMGILSSQHGIHLLKVGIFEGWDFKLCLVSDPFIFGLACGNVAGNCCDSMGSIGGFGQKIYAAGMFGKGFFMCIKQCHKTS